MGACLSDTKNIIETNDPEMNNENDGDSQIQTPNCSATLVADQLALLQLSLDNSTKVYRKAKQLHKRNESGTYLGYQDSLSLANRF